MNKKRGWLLLVLVVFLLVCSLGVVSQSISNDVLPSHWALVVFGQDDDTCTKGNAMPVIAVSKELWAADGLAPDSSHFEINKNQDDTLDILIRQNFGIIIDKKPIACSWLNLQLSKTGCYFFAADANTGLQYMDHCAGVELKSGYILDQNPGEISVTSDPIDPSETLENGDVMTTVFNCDEFSTLNDFSLICADKTITWSEQGEEKTEQRKVWLECNQYHKDAYVKPDKDGTKTYQCQERDGEYGWWVVAEKGDCITASDGEKCCGTDAKSGDVVFDDADKQNYICLNKNMVGRKGGIDQDIAGWTCSDENWCWVSPITAMFNVLTIREPGKPAYDVVSNSVNWFKCSQNSLGRLELPKGITTYDAEVNRFYCYQEGSHWSWAECPGGGSDVGYNKDTIKARNAGEGLYNFYLADAQTETSGNLKERVAYGNGITIELDSEDYTDFYDETLFDFSGYDYLNFMVRFVKDDQGTPFDSADELELPTDVSLGIYGPKQSGNYVPYFEKNVLSYAINNPSLGEEWIHVRVPVTDFKGVARIVIKSAQPDFNKIAVKNVYLSKQGEKPILCSGESTSNVNYGSWMDDVDQSIDGNPITGEKLCRSWYGDNAWLGHFGKDEVDADSASCCGNEENEYYAGNSKADKDGIKYGCWNSQPVASGDTITNVEFQIDYRQEMIVVDYPVINFRYTISHTANPVFPPTASDAVSAKIEFGESPKVLNSFEKIGGVIAFGAVKTGKLTISSDNPSVDVYFYEPTNNLEGNELIVDDLPTTTTVYFMAKVNDNYKITTQTLPVFKAAAPGEKIEPEKITYSCSEDACIFPLPGLPPYMITNTHPGLYELYFVNDKGEVLVEEPREKFLTEQKFDTAGNLKIKKIAQQVIYISQDEDTSKNLEEDRNFYGCQAASFIESLNRLTDLPYCSVKADKFCSHNNSWSDDGISRTGYKELGPTETAVPDIFDLTADAFVAEKRNQSSTAVPGKNFIPNAEFKTKGKEIPYWRIDIAHLIAALGGTTIPKDSDFLGDDQTSIELGAEEYLISDKIAIGKNLDLSFSQNESLMPLIRLIDKDGKETIVPADSSANFNTGENVFLILEFAGPGTIEKPMLQVVDDLGAVSYEYLPEDETNRAGAACCPADYCWNGYVCVRDMSKISYMTEKIEKGREYRCISGKWTYLPPQWDWNFDKYEFCSSKDQCFVLSSLEGGDASYKAKDFYDGNIPICVDTGESVFDHYCDQGNWTSRTKFLADQLMEFAEQDDYVLYCSSYQSVLVDYQDQISYLGGNTPVTVKDTTGTGSLLGQTQTKTVNVCFSGLVGDKYSKLLPPKKNTCVNNICVLKAKQGGDFKTAFAATLNKDLNDKDDSFLLSMNINPGAVNCPDKEGFVKCAGVSGDLWYSKELNAVIYSKDGISITGTLSGRITQAFGEWAGRFLGIFTGPSKEKSIVEEATAFNELYLLKNGEKKISVIRETFPGKEVLAAEYEHFETPVCSYVDNLNSPGGEIEILKAYTEEAAINCAELGDTQKVIISDSLDFWWPQLTGMLRVNE